jgi:CMP-N,N'-diacetyllegionaminic acid synthase
MTILALIPARGGSKRLPGKNIKLLGGKPLIEWSIDVAKNIDDICDILVSTDDECIADIAKNAGALVPWLRPAELSNETASSVDVAMHALDWFECEKGKIDGLLLLQPTSPFRTRKTLLRGLSLFKKDKNNRSVVGVSRAESHPMLCFSVEEDSMIPFIDGIECHSRSQDLPPAYEVNGSFYLVSSNRFKATKSFYGNETIPLLIDSFEESIDIDTELDWKMAELILKDREDLKP